MACCRVQELHQKISFSPDLGNIDLLKNLDGGGGASVDQCSINLDKRTGKYPPFILRSSNEVAYPEGSRTLNFGMKSH